MSNWVKGHYRPSSWPLQWPSSPSNVGWEKELTHEFGGSAALEDDACFLRKRSALIVPWAERGDPPEKASSYFASVRRRSKEEHLHNHRYCQAVVPKLCKSFTSKAINLNEGWGTNVLEQKASNFHMKYRRFYSWIRLNEPSFLPNFQGWVFTSSFETFFATFISSFYCYFSTWKNDVIEDF